MTRFVAGIALAVLGVSFSPALADTRADPNQKNSSVILEKSGKVPGERRSNTRATANAVYVSPIRDWFVQCPVDAEIGNYGCRVDTTDEPEEEADEPEVTEADVLRAVREIGMPRLQVQIQPGTRTLVNAETIFYAEPQPFERTVTLLGTDVDLVAEPARFTWFHGDGTTATTSRAGRPYPALDIVHRYREPAEQVSARVDVTYRVRYRIAGGAWQELGETLTASGPAATLAVREAAPVLVAPQ